MVLVSPPVTPEYILLSSCQFPSKQEGKLLRRKDWNNSDRNAIKMKGSYFQLL